MVVFKSNFNNTYDELSTLNETTQLADAEQAVEVLIKGKKCNFKTPFLTKAEIESLYNTPELKVPGIYVFKCNAPGTLTADPRYYVGKAIILRKRIRDHFCMNKRDSVALHAAIKAHGAEAFQVAIVEHCSRELLNERERFWIDYLDTYNDRHDYNLTKGGDGALGRSKITEDMFKEVVKDLQNKSASGHEVLTSREIAEKWGISEATVTKINDGTHFLHHDLGIRSGFKVDVPIRTLEDQTQIKSLKTSRAVLPKKCIVFYKDSLIKGFDNKPLIFDTIYAAAKYVCYEHPAIDSYLLDYKGEDDLIFKRDNSLLLRIKRDFCRRNRKWFDFQVKLLEEPEEI